MHGYLYGYETRVEKGKKEGNENTSDRKESELYQLNPCNIQSGGGEGEKILSREEERKKK